MGKWQIEFYQSSSGNPIVKEIEIAEKRRKEFLARESNDNSNDIKPKKKRKNNDKK